MRDMRLSRSGLRQLVDGPEGAVLWLVAVISLGWLNGGKLCLCRVTLVPGHLELLDAFEFQHIKHIDEVDANPDLPIPPVQLMQEEREPAASKVSMAPLRCSRGVPRITTFARWKPSIGATTT